MRRIRWWLPALLAVLLSLAPGQALAHSAPLKMRWTVTPGTPVAGQPVIMAFEVLDSLGGSTPGLDLSLQAQAQGQTSPAQKLTEVGSGQYSGTLTLPTTGPWTFKVIIHVLDENQVATLKLDVAAQAPAQNPPLTTEQWMTIEYTTFHVILTWGAFAAGLAIIGVLLLTGRKAPPDAPAPNSGEERKEA